MDTAEDEGVDVTAGFAPHSPWSQPPIHRPTAKPAPEPEPVGEPPPAGPPRAIHPVYLPLSERGGPTDDPRRAGGRHEREDPAPVSEPPFAPRYSPDATYYPEPAATYQPGPEPTYAAEPTYALEPTYTPEPASGYRPPANPVTVEATYRLAIAPPPAPATEPPAGKEPRYQEPAYQEPVYEADTQRFPMADIGTIGRPPLSLTGTGAPATGPPAAGLPAALAYPEVDAPLTYPVPTAEEFATRRTVRPREWVATTGVRAAARRGTFGLVRLRPNRREREGRIDLAAVRRAFGGLRQITVVNPKGGAGKTVATLMLALTFGQTRGGFVLAWDNNETQGTLGMRAQPDLHARTVRDLLRDLDRFGGGGGPDRRAGGVRALPGRRACSTCSPRTRRATAGEMLTARAFREIREVVGRFYKLILVDTGNNVRAENWQAAIDATDQLVITMSARNDSAETAARLLDHLEQTGRRELVRRAVTVVTMPPHRKEVDPRAIERHFDQRVPGRAAGARTTGTSTRARRSATRRCRRRAAAPGSGRRRGGRSA